MRTNVLLVRLINIFVSIIEGFLGMRFILKLFGANPRAGFVDWVYDTSEPLLEPFRGMFPSPVVDGGFVFEFSTLFAMMIYAIIGWLVMELIYFTASAVKNGGRRLSQ